MTEPPAPLFRVATIAAICAAALVVAAACAVRPPARTGPPEAAAQTPHIPALAAYVADSIVVEGSAEASAYPQAVAEARGLPGTFVVDPHVRRDRAGSACDAQLLDPRDGTLLLLMQSIEVRETIDGVSRVRAVGYYHPASGARYGAANGQWLRVGCRGTAPLADAHVFSIDSVANALRQRYGGNASVTKTGTELAVSFTAPVLGADVTIASDSARAVARDIWRTYAQAAGVERITVGVPVADTVSGVQLNHIKVYSYRDGMMR